MGRLDKSYYLGIDPGLSGAVALFDHNGMFLEVFDMPVKPNNKPHAFVKRVVHSGHLSEMLRDDRLQIAFLEDVTSMSRDGVASAFAFGESLGAVKGVLAALGIETYLVPARDWKKEFGLIKQPKAASIPKALMAAPSAPLTLKKHAGRADAILIGLYGLARLHRLEELIAA